MILFQVLFDFFLHRTQKMNAVNIYTDHEQQIFKTDENTIRSTIDAMALSDEHIVKLEAI